MTRPRARRKLEGAVNRPYASEVVTIELFGVPRLRAGRDSLSVDASTLGEALRALARACPEVGAAVVCDDGSPGAAYLVALNGGRFTRDATASLRPGDTLVLLSAQAGG